MPQPKPAHGVAVWEAIVIPGRMGRLAEKHSRFALAAMNRRWPVAV